MDYCNYNTNIENSCICCDNKNNIYLCIDIWQYIMTYCYIIEQLAIMRTCREMYNNLYIYNLDTFHNDIKMSYKIEYLLTNIVLEQKKFSNLKSLLFRDKRRYFITWDNILSLSLDYDTSLKNYIQLYKVRAWNKISDVNNFGYLKHLEKLIIPRNNYIVNSTFELYTNLKVLNIEYCRRITNINCLINLEELNISGSCGVSDSGIANLNLKKIIVRKNTKITNISHMTNLEYIDISYTNIDNNGIKNLNPSYLNLENNKTITNINHMTNLKYLYLTDTIINNDGIRNINPIELFNNIYIDKFNHMTNLKYLNTTILLSFNDDTFEKLDLKSLTLHGNENNKIINFNSMINLEHLHLYNLGFMSEEAIKELRNLKSLILHNTCGLTNFNHMSNLKYLKMINTDHVIFNPISNEGIDKLKNIESLIIQSDNSITKIDHMIKLRKIFLTNSILSNNEIEKMNFKHMECMSIHTINESKYHICNSYNCNHDINKLIIKNWHIDIKSQIWRIIQHFFLKYKLQLLILTIILMTIMSLLPLKILVGIILFVKIFAISMLILFPIMEDIITSFVEIFTILMLLILILLNVIIIILILFCFFVIYTPYKLISIGLNTIFRYLI